METSVALNYSNKNICSKLGGSHLTDFNFIWNMAFLDTTFKMEIDKYIF